MNNQLTSIAYISDGKWEYDCVYTFSKNPTDIRELKNKYQELKRILKLDTLFIYQ